MIRTLRLAQALALPLLATACAAIVDFPALPASEDAGADATVPDGGGDTGQAQDGTTGDSPADATVAETTQSDGPAGDAATDATAVDSSPGTDGPAGDSGTADSACATPCDDGGCATPTDIHNCGACGNDCTALPNVSASGLSCVGGVCHYTCSAAFMDCNATPGMGCGTNITLPATCGGCTTSCVGTSTPNCTEGDAGMYGCSLTCGGGTTNCGGTCANTQTDPSFCGASCTACPSVANGTPTCAAGTCGASCASGYSGCGTPGSCEYDTNTDPTHCGAGCTACPGVTNGIAACTSGGCSAMCTQGYSACGGATPCQFDTTSDPGHCGASCASCPGATNGTAVCNASTCGVACNPGFGACSGSCYSTNTDPSHCGAACTVCSAGQVCAAGQCGPTLVWGADVSDAAVVSAVFPSVAVGTSASYGAWAVQVDQQAYVSGSGPNLSWQAGAQANAGSFAVPAAYTFGWQPSIAALASTGLIVAVHDADGLSASSPTPKAGGLYWFFGSLTSATSMTWPTGNSYGMGFRPRIAAIPSSGGATSALEVHMSAAGAGPLYYTPALAPTGPSNNGVSLGGSVEYDMGASQSPVVAIGPSAGSSTVLVELHNDSMGTSLYYRLGTLTPGVATGGPSNGVSSYPVPSFGTSTAFGTGGAHPAIALYQHPTYGLVAIEVHEANGGLYAALGVVSGSTITWEPAVQVDASGTLPSIAIDPATGNGLATHQSATAGKIVENTFTIH